MLGGYVMESSGANIMNTNRRMWIGCVGVMLLLGGCGDGLAGRYVAEVRRVAEVADVPARYSLEEVGERLMREPEVIELWSGGRFERRREDQVIWEGTWRRDEQALYLLATTVQGTRVTRPLQSEKRYELDGGTIVDTGMFSAYGLHVVYVKR